MNLNNKKIGILGGGQLGRMFIEETIKFDLNISILDPNEECPSRHLATKYVKGNFNNYEDVLAFGREVDLITIEIEHVNTEALYQLVKEGKEVYPQPNVIELIKDKGTQKQFYATHDIPTSSFKLIDNNQDLKSIAIPFVAKKRTGGYDGNGVKVVRSLADLDDEFFNAAILVEELIPFEKELSVIIGRNKKGEVTTYDMVEQEFNTEANLVEFLFAPADVNEDIKKRGIEIAEKIISKLDMVGILAVELFLTKDGELLVNEMAPRAHNSGHHTIEANEVSQFELHARTILNLPLGNTKTVLAGVMINLLGDKSYQGEVVYEEIEKAMNTNGAFIHLYGKKMTKPFRKMGHLTVVSDDLDEAKSKALLLKELVKVKGNKKI